MKNWLLFVFGPLLAIETCARAGNGTCRVSIAVADVDARQVTQYSELCWLRRQDSELTTKTGGISQKQGFSVCMGSTNAKRSFSTTVVLCSV